MGLEPIADATQKELKAGIAVVGGVIHPFDATQKELKDVPSTVLVMNYSGYDATQKELKERTRL